MVHMGDVSPSIWDDVVEVMEKKLKDIDFQEDDILINWRKQANKKKFDREIFEKYGYFKTDYKIAADYEILTRFMAKHAISYSYIPKVFVKMRTGGVSSANFKSNWILNEEIVRACRENGIKTNMPKVLLKYFTKIFQLVRK